MSNIEEIRQQGKLSRPEKRQINRSATEAEILEAKTSFADFSISVQKEKLDLAILKKQYKTSIDFNQSQAGISLKIVETGRIDVEEDCEKRLYFDENKVRYFSSVTGEFVLERPMTGDDRQKDIEFADEEQDPDQMLYEEQLMSQMN